MTTTTTTTGPEDEYWSCVVDERTPDGVPLTPPVRLTGPVHDGMWHGNVPYRRGWDGIGWGERGKAAEGEVAVRPVHVLTGRSGPGGSGGPGPTPTNSFESILGRGEKGGACSLTDGRGHVYQCCVVPIWAGGRLGKIESVVCLAAVRNLYRRIWFVSGCRGGWMRGGRRWQLPTGGSPRRKSWLELSGFLLLSRWVHPVLKLPEIRNKVGAVPLPSRAVSLRSTPGGNVLQLYR